MSIWAIAALSFVLAMAMPGLLAASSDTLTRFLALQLAAGLASWVLVLLTFAFDQPSFIDLPLCAAMLSLPGGLLIALCLERWL